MSLTVGSLFAGIGGLDLGLERAGFEIRWQVEVDPFCRKVLEKHWPNVPKYGDIRNLSGVELERVDLICGGFPCQPFSLAGRRKAGRDERNFWPEYLRIVRVLRPDWVLGENVPGLVSAERGMFFLGILQDLEAAGYSVSPYKISAADCGAPHRRLRLFIVGSGDALAHAESECGELRAAEGERPRGLAGGNELVAHAHRPRRGWEILGGETVGQDTSRPAGRASGPSCAVPFPPGPDDAEGWREYLRRYPDCAPSVESDVRRSAPWHPFGLDGRRVSGDAPKAPPYPARTRRLKALGNAVVPQCAEAVGWMIRELAEGGGCRRERNDSLIRGQTFSGGNQAPTPGGRR